MPSDNLCRPRLASTLGLPELMCEAELTAARLAKLKRWGPAFRGASPDLPLLVGRLDLAGVYYAIVAFRIGDHLTARMRLDAHTGQYAEATGVEKAGARLKPYETADDIRRRLLRMRGAPTPRAGRSATPVVDPMMVWQPSAQSPTPFLPFYRVTAGRRVRFWRVDGRDFDTLGLGAGV